jgi:hypothetical protein
MLQVDRPQDRMPERMPNKKNNRIYVTKNARKDA